MIAVTEKTSFLLAIRIRLKTEFDLALERLNALQDFSRDRQAFWVFSNLQQTLSDPACAGDAETIIRHVDSYLTGRGWTSATLRGMVPLLTNASGKGETGFRLCLNSLRQSHENETDFLLARLGDISRANNAERRKKSPLNALAA